MYTEAMSASQFRHGPFELIKENLQVLFFNPKGKTYEINERYVLEMAELGAKILYVSMEDGITRTETPTAISVGVVNQTGSRYFVTYSGNLYDFTKEIVQNVQDFNKAKASFFYGYFLLPNFGFEGTLSCLKQAKANEHLTFFYSNSDIGGWSEKSRNEITALLKQPIHKN